MSNVFEETTIPLPKSRNSIGWIEARIDPWAYQETNSLQLIATVNVNGVTFSTRNWVGVDWMQSRFDVIWENMGRILKDAVLKADNEAQQLPLDTPPQS